PDLQHLGRIADSVAHTDGLVCPVAYRGAVADGLADEVGELVEAGTHTSAQVQWLGVVLFHRCQRATDHIVDVDEVPDLLAVAPDVEGVGSAPDAVEKGSHRIAGVLVGGPSGERPEHMNLQALGSSLGGEAFPAELHPAVGLIRYFRFPDV